MLASPQKVALHAVAERSISHVDLVTMTYQRHAHVADSVSVLPRLIRTRRGLMSTTSPFAAFLLLVAVVTACSASPTTRSASSPAKNPSAVVSTDSSNTTPPSSAEPATAPAPSAALVNSAVLLAPNVKCAILLDSLNSVLPEKLDRTDGGRYDERRKEAECIYRKGIAGMERVVFIMVAKDVPLSQYEEVAALDLWKDPVKDLTAMTGFTSRVMVQVSLRSVRLFAWKDGFTVDASVTGESLTDDGYASFLKALMPHTLSPSDASPAPVPAPSAISANAGVCHVSAEKLAAAFSSPGSHDKVFSEVESDGQCAFRSQDKDLYVGLENFRVTSEEDLAFACGDTRLGRWPFHGGTLCKGGIGLSTYYAFFQVKGVNQYVRYEPSYGSVDEQGAPALMEEFKRGLSTAIFGTDCSFSDC